MRFSRHVFDEILNRLDLVGFIASHGVAVKRAGATYKACCPFHKEKTPSFSIHPQRRFYHCFGCGEHGDAITFHMRQTGLSFNDAVVQLAEKTGVKLERDHDPDALRRELLLALHADLAAFYQRCLQQSKEAASARAFLEGRNLGPDIVKRFGIGYAPLAPNAVLRWADKHHYALNTLVDAGILAPGKSDTPYDRFAGRVTFPIHDAQGRVIAFSCRVLDPRSHPAKYVNSPETLVFKKSQVLYGLHLARGPITKHPRREAVLCEGQVDVIRCHSAGFDTAVASQGTAFTPGHVEILKRYADSILVAYDSDTAGQKAALKAGAMLLAAGLPVRVLNLPPGEDPDSLIRRDGPSAFQSCMARAVSLTAFQVGFLRQAEPDPNALDAVSRVLHPVVETLASCPSAVLRAHLLSEAADLLRVPAEALREDLEKFQKEAAAAAVMQTASPGANRPHPTTPESHPPPSAFVPQPSSPTLQPSSFSPQPSPQPSLPSRPQADLCRLLFHHAGDDRNLPRLIKEWLSPDLPLHDFTRRILKAAMDDFEARVTLHIPALASDPDPLFQHFHATLANADSRIAMSEDLKPLDEARELVSKIWSDEILKSRRETLAPDDPRRPRFTRAIKLLQHASWEVRQQLLRPFLSGEEPMPPHQG